MIRWSFCIFLISLLMPNMNFTSWMDSNFLFCASHFCNFVFLYFGHLLFVYFLKVRNLRGKTEILKINKQNTEYRATKVTKKQSYQNGMKQTLIFMISICLQLHTTQALMPCPFTGPKIQKNTVTKMKCTKQKIRVHWRCEIHVGERSLMTSHIIYIRVGRGVQDSPKKGTL